MAGAPKLLTRAPRFEATVTRPRLAAASKAGGATVIIGAAGWGKSVLARQIADLAGQRLLWCRLAPAWAEAADLESLVLLAAGGTPDQEGPRDLLEIADTIIGLLEDEPTCLVIDDLHHGVGTGVEPLLAEVVHALPVDSQIIVTSRRRPAELIGLAGGSGLSEVGELDLAMTADEISEVWRLQGLDAPSPDVAESSRGWPAAVATIAASGGEIADGIESVMGRLLTPTVLGDLHDLAVATTLVPYLTVEMVEAMGLGGIDELRRLADLGPGFELHDRTLRAHDSARPHLRDRHEPEVVLHTRIAGARAMALEDPATAIELLVDADAHTAAGELLAAHASVIGPDRATRWLYRLPAEVRRSMPPVLAGGRATVNVDLAILSARDRVAATGDTDPAQEARLGLGSLLLAAGDLGEAAAVLEAAQRAVADGAASATSIAEHLAHARWYAGDAAGARAALAAAEDTVWSELLWAQLALLDDDPSVAAEIADRLGRSEPTSQEASTLSATIAGAVALIEGGDASDPATVGYESAVDTGGRELAIAGLVQAASLLRDAKAGEALRVAEQVERTVGRHDYAARMTVALIRRAATAADPTLGDADRDRRRVSDLATKGYAPLISLADRLFGPGDSQPTGLEVRLTGSFGVVVDGTEIPTSNWKSRKALEVCAVVASAGPAGLRREQAIEAVWPDRPADKGRTLLRTALSEIRRVLEPRRAAGQDSRFVTAEADRVTIHGTTDLARAEAIAATGDHVGAFHIVKSGPAPDLPDSEWAIELANVLGQAVVESATRVVQLDLAASEDTGVEPVTAAWETLIAAEPWSRDHYDGLAAHHRASGDDLAAADVERRWFADEA